LTQQWQSGRDDDDPATEIQWTDIPGATARTYATPPLQLADDGTLFRQVATNTVGSAISRVARVSVLAAPVFPSIASQPQWLAVQASEHAFFSVQAGGGGLSYAWERSSDGRNFQPIPDTDAPTFTLFNATLADDNSWFRVSARNSAGVVTSDAALLRVSLLPPARRRVSGGEQFSVGLHSDGSLRSWGQGHTWGALGDGTFEPRSDAVQVALIDDARAVSIGTRHSLVVRSNGEVWGWGKGLHGELGAAANEATPIRIASIILARAVAAGHGHFSPSDDRDDLSAYPSDFSLVASANGIVRAWGRNESGQLGDGTINSRPDAQLVGTLSGVINVAAGSGHSLALRSDGSVYAWGRNEHGQLGDGQIAASLRPIPVAIPVAAPATVIEIVASGSTSYALDSRGDVWAWGNNSAGNVGDGTTADKPSPQLVPLPMPAKSIAAGLNHAVALLLDGRVFAWGSNEFGECACGAQPTASANLPAHVANLPPDIVAIGAGTAHSLALDADGNVWGWGRNDTFQLNDGTSLNRGQPVMVNNVDLNGADVAPPHLTNRIAAGAAHSLAVRDGGVSGSEVFSWGSDQEGQLGSGPGQEDRNRPAVIASPNRVRAVAAGDLHSLAVLENGDVWGWGWNDQGALGEIEESVFIETPGRIPDVSGVRTACGGGLHSIFLLEDGTLLALGANANGQLGAGSTAQNSITALRVTGLEGVTAIACGRNHSLALMSDNTVRAWGRNHRGQLGNGSFDDQPVRSPVAVSNLTDVVAIAAGHNHSLALLRNGSVWAWGSNERGQLGDGTTEMRLLPVPALAAGRFVQLAGGPEFSVALRAGGGVVAWGDNQSAQLGIGGQEPAFSAEPVEPSISNVIEIRAGNSHVLAVRADLSLWAWGANHFGQLGAGSTVDVIPSPVVLPDLAP
jgi:alpha-tubulin suppressor-like RCC1 family protein